MYIQNSTELPFPLYTGLPLPSLHRVITFRNTELIIIHRASPPREYSAYLHHTQYTELLLPGTQSFTAHLQPLSHNSPGKALCFFSSVHRASASRNTELLPRGNTVLNLHQTQYTELMLSSGMLPPTKPHTPGKLCASSPPCTELRTPSKALCFFIPLSQNYHLPEHRACNRTQSFTAHLRLLNHTTPGKALCFFSSVHRDSASRNTELHPR